MSIYGVYKNQVLTAPPEMELSGEDNLTITTYENEERALLINSIYTRKLIGVVGVIPAVMGRFGVLLLITESGSIYTLNDHQEEYGHYVGQIKM